MRPDSQEVSTPKEWFARARSNLIRAEQPKPDGVYWEDICFDAQQACEKALKALLIQRGIAFRFVHNIGELLKSLAESNIEIPAEVLSSAELTEFSVETRYPGPFESVTEEEAKEAIRITRAVLDWVESKL